MLKKFSIAPVSVIIPVFNRLDVLCTAIESVFAQTLPPHEIIVVNDGSDIHLGKTLKPYLNRIIYIELNSNKGVSSARNAGVALSTGDFIAFLDSDDIWLHDKIALQYEFMLNNDYLISHTDEYWWRKDRFVNKAVTHQKHGGDIFCNILDICRVSMSCFMINKQLFLDIGGFDECLRVCEDYDLAIRLAALYNIGYLERKCTIKRAVMGNSLSAGIQYIENIRYDILNNIQKSTMSLTASKSACLDYEINRKALLLKNRKQ